MGHTSYNRRDGYVQGSAVRKTLKPGRDGRHIESIQPKTRKQREAEKVSYINVLYMVFLAAAACLVLISCIHYLQLQEQTTSKVKHIAQLETQLENMKKENDDNYTRIQTSVDLDYIKDVAINELGMVYAKADQVILYDGGTRDYVRQSGEIPKDHTSNGKILGK